MTISKFMLGAIVCSSIALQTAALAKPATDSSKAMSASKHTKVVHVDGAAMYPDKDIIENASQSPIHKTLVAAVTAAGLVDTLKGAGALYRLCPYRQGLCCPSGRHSRHTLKA